MRCRSVSSTWASIQQVREAEAVRQDVVAVEPYQRAQVDRQGQQPGRPGECEAGVAQRPVAEHAPEQGCRAGKRDLGQHAARIDQQAVAPAHQPPGARDIGPQHRRQHKATPTAGTRQPSREPVSVLMHRLADAECEAHRQHAPEREQVDQAVAEQLPLLRYQEQRAGDDDGKGCQVGAGENPAHEGQRRGQEAVRIEQAKAQGQVGVQQPGAGQVPGGAARLTSRVVAAGMTGCIRQARSANRTKSSTSAAVGVIVASAIRLLRRSRALHVAGHPASSLRRGKSGAGEGIRTLDPNLGKVVLYP